MRDRLRTLYLDCSGIASLMVPTDTLLRGLLGYREGDRPPAMLRNCVWANAWFAELRDVHARLSYVGDWRDAFASSPDLAVEVCNINNLIHFGRSLLRLRQYDLIVVSHAAAGDDMTVLTRAAGWFDRRRAPIVMFIGNEYDLLDQKIGFIRDVECEFLSSQLPISAASYLYRECSASRIVEMPHALNPDKYFPTPTAHRDVDIGFVGDIYWPFIGDRERTELIEWFEEHGAERGLRCEIRRQRMPRDAWCAFLNGCKATIGAESGTYYLNERCRLLEQARAYNLFERPDASFDEIYDRFYRDAVREVSGKSISSRHFEPIGTKTCQILLEGYYNGILDAGRHYIAIRRDFSNLDAAIERFRDQSFRARMVEDTYEFVLSQHTYAHRVAQLVRMVVGRRECGLTRTIGSMTTAESAGPSRSEARSDDGLWDR